MEGREKAKEKKEREKIILLKRQEGSTSMWRRIRLYELLILTLVVYR